MPRRNRLLSLLTGAGLFAGGCAHAPASSDQASETQIWSQARAVMEAHRGEIQACLDEHWATSPRPNRVVAEFRLNSLGTHSYSIHRSDTSGWRFPHAPPAKATVAPPTALETCLLEPKSGWAFPVGGGPLTGVYLFMSLADGSPGADPAPGDELWKTPNGRLSYLVGTRSQPKRISGELPIARNGGSGRVFVNCALGEDGLLSECHALSPPSRPQEVPVPESLRTWRYEPARVAGVPVPLDWVEPVAFR